MLLHRVDRASVCAGVKDGHANAHGDGYPHANRERFHHCGALRHAQPAYRDCYLFPHCNLYADAYTDTAAFADAFPAPNVHAHSPDVHLYALQHTHHANADLYSFQHTSAAIGYAPAAYGDSDTVGDPYPPLSFAGMMPELASFLKSLLSAPGLSGYETPVAKLIEEKWHPLLDEITTSRLGSLHGLKKGAAAAGKGPSVLVAAHMDAIGLMVTHVVDGGLLHVTAIGGIDARVLPGTPVTVYATGGDASQELFGIIIQPPARTLPASLGDNPVGINYLLVDVGLPHKQVLESVRTGDIVSFATPPVELAGDVISGHSLDNRVSVAALTVALEELQGKSHAWDVWAVATAQEEETLGGAATSAFELHPHLAIAVDVTFAKGPGANDWQTFPLGKGPTLGFGPNLHPFLHRSLKDLAEKLEIPYSVEVLPRHSGTDAYAMQVAAEGIPTMVIGIPLRYMHTPVEMVTYKDIQRTGRLIAEFIAALEPDFVEKITWDEERS
jgi:tetrahedral aminopeptidase